jgi:hypothetical protein
MIEGEGAARLRLEDQRGGGEQQRHAERDLDQVAAPSMARSMSK